jgi:predicted RNA methylase
MKFLEAIASTIISCMRILRSNPSLDTAMRVVERRNTFNNVYLHEQMLADSVRLDAYHAAIQRYVTSEDYVVDVGTGTGVLAFSVAAKNPRKLYAIDHSKRLLAYAKATAEASGIPNLTFISLPSHKFRPAEPIDVIVQEQMGIALFDEGMVETILDVRDRCLKPGGRILPARFEFYLEPIQLLKRERIPLIQEQQIRGVTFQRTPIAVERDHLFREIDDRDVEFLLCEPESVFTFDLTTLTRDQIPKLFSSRKPVRRSGQVDGICIYFKAAFDDDISFSTGPKAVKTHWPMLLYRTPALNCQVGDIFELGVEAHDLVEYCDWSWRIDIHDGTA